MASVSKLESLLKRTRTRVARAELVHKNIVLYRLPATTSRSSAIPCRQSAKNDSLAPKPSHNPALAVLLTAQRSTPS